MLWARAAAAREQMRAARARAEQVRQLWLSDAAGQRQMRYSAHARLRARLASMPVIEQAKGIIMAQTGWSEAEAFDALRQASQRSNVPVRELAATIVARTVATGPAQRPVSGPAPAGGRAATRDRRAQ